MYSFSKELEGIEGTQTAESMATDLLDDLREAAEQGHDAAIYFGSTSYEEFIYKIFFGEDPNGRMVLFHRLCAKNSLGVNPTQQEDHDRAVAELSNPRFSRIEIIGFRFTGPRGYQDLPEHEPSCDR